MALVRFSYNSGPYEEHHRFTGDPSKCRYDTIREVPDEVVERFEKASGEYWDALMALQAYEQEEPVR